MTHDDMHFVRHLIAQGMITGPVLELGVGWGGATCRDLLRDACCEYVGTDLEPGAGVDHVANFETGAGLGALANRGGFSSILVLNVLEHTFEPVRVLDHALGLLRADGRLVVITPAAWPIHNYPRDYVRLLPDWYRQYAASRNLELSEEHFRYLGMGDVRKYRSGDLDSLPPCAPGSAAYRIYSRLIHRLFNTFARAISSPAHVAIGAVFHKRGTPRCAEAPATEPPATPSPDAAPPGTPPQRVDRACG